MSSSVLKVSRQVGKNESTTVYKIAEMFRGHEMIVRIVDETDIQLFRVPRELIAGKEYALQLDEVGECIYVDVETFKRSITKSERGGYITTTQGLRQSGAYTVLRCKRVDVRDWRDKN